MNVPSVMQLRTSSSPVPVPSLIPSYVLQRSQKHRRKKQIFVFGSTQTQQSHNKRLPESESGLTIFSSLCRSRNRFSPIDRKKVFTKSHEAFFPSISLNFCFAVRDSVRDKRRNKRKIMRFSWIVNVLWMHLLRIRLCRPLQSLIVLLFWVSMQIRRLVALYQLWLCSGAFAESERNKNINK